MKFTATNKKNRFFFLFYSFLCEQKVQSSVRIRSQWDKQRYNTNNNNWLRKENRKFAYNFD